ncbi:MAG: ABC transporter ATP-binding protein [Pirellulales bacterium]
MIRSNAMIRFDRLHRHFGSTRAVDDVSFEVHRGEVFGYIGPNGAGKTTSMRILATLDLPTAGDAYVDGFSVVDDPDRVRQRLGFMPDYFGTYTNVNVQEYLDFFARAYGLTGKKRLRAISYVMDFTQLDQLAEKPISGLSKGMKQRLCLGRTMVHDPPVMVLDEPAAGLDPRARIELREMIARLAADGKAVLISSHILAELGEMCDRVAIIEQGSLVAVGSVDEIRRQAETRSTIRVRVLEGADRLAAWIEARGVDELYKRNGAYVFTHEGDPQSEADLLREMVEAGFSVVEFAAHSDSLEDVFLRVTRGMVQ